MTSAASFFSFVSERIDSVLDTLIPAGGEHPQTLHEAIRWSLFAGGKRVRPAIVIAAARAFGAHEETALRTAAAIEMIHTYSLIHDDLPSMDDDDLRRGRPTCHVKFGEAAAILAGDVLQTLAFQTIADDDGLPAEVRISLIKGIAAASGTPDGMVAGQQLDLDAEGSAPDAAALRRIHERKTGALISASAAAGAIIGRAPAGDIDAMRQYGRHLGLLFQITDDLLDVTQATETLGKTAGKDVLLEKATYPRLYGLEQTGVMADTALDEALAALSGSSANTGLLGDIARSIRSRTR